MDMKKLASVCVAATSLMMVMPAEGDVLYMSDGQKQVGVIIENRTDNRNVTIRTTAGDLTIPRTKIARIENTSTGESYAQLGDEYLTAGNNQKALETYEAGLQLDPGNLDLQQRAQTARGGMATQRAEAQVALDGRARRVVDQARQLAAQKNFDAAYNLMRTVAPSDVSPARAQYDAALADLFLQWGLHLYDHQNTGDAAQKFTEVLKLDPENARAKQLLIRTFEGDPTKLNETAAYYLQSQDPDERMRGAESLFKLQQYDQALPIFMEYIGNTDLNHRYNITNRVTSMLDTLHRQAASRGDYVTALQYFTQYIQVNPDPEADPTPYSKYIYMIKREQTDMNNPQSRLELALLAEELGLIPTAKEEYRNILTMDAESSGALAALRRFAESDLADAREFMAQGNYVLADQMSQTMISEYGMYPDLLAQANQIMAQARVEAQRIAQNTRQQAVALAERGDNYYSQAMEYWGAYVSTEIDINKRAFSPRNEASKYLGQALFAWRTALQMDPTLGDPTTYNLHFKIQDATAKYSQIANRRPPPLPPRVNRSRRTAN